MSAVRRSLFALLLTGCFDPNAGLGTGAGTDEGTASSTDAIEETDEPSAETEDPPGATSGATAGPSSAESAETGEPDGSDEAGGSTDGDPDPSTATGPSPEDDCGNGIVDGGEECDGSAGAYTCMNLAGLPEGEIQCTRECTLDISDCSAGAAARRVFVTSSAYAADFGGALGADEACQFAADDAGLGGVFMAWLSDSTTTPNARFVHADAPYELLDGTQIASDWDDLTDGQIATAIAITDAGQPVDPPSTIVATATTAAGDLQPFNGHCQDWSTTSASESMTIGNEENTFSWSDSGAVGCGTPVSLYCFEQ